MKCLLIINKLRKNEYNNPGVFLGMNESTLGKIINTLLEELDKKDFSLIVLIEIAAAILNYVKHEELIKFIIPTNLKYLIKTVQENHDKPRILAIQCLQQIGKVSEYKFKIEELGGEGILEISI